MAMSSRRHVLDPLPPITAYPRGDFKPMPSFQHERALFHTEALLIGLYAPGSLVSHDLMILRDPQNWRDHVMPDILVALGAGELDPVYGEPRHQYRLWDEAGPPDLVIEAASVSTVGRDNVGKREEYAAMGVREYVQFDPTGKELLDPRLQVFRLAGDHYERIPAGLDGSVASEVLLGYAWVRVGDLLRLRDLHTGQLVPLPEEAAAEAQAAAERAEDAATQARAAAERAETRADKESLAREQAETRAREAEAELARLRAMLAKLQDQAGPSEE